MNMSQPTSNQKWLIALIAGLLFLLIGSPFLYRAVDSLLRGLVGPIAQNGCPTMLGLVLHAVVFLLVVRAIMW